MDKIYLGKITSFHGLKGEIRLISNFPYKEKCFAVGKHIIIDDNSYTIASYRKHQKYDMLKLVGYDSIESVYFFKNKKVYQDRDELHLDNNQFVMEDLIKAKVYTTDNEEGVVVECFDAGNHNYVLRLNINNKEYLIPAQEPFVKEIDRANKCIKVELIK